MSSKKTKAKDAMPAAATTTTTVSGIPLVIIIDILSRLPVKSIIRFKSVSKSWLALIKSSALVTAHLNRSAQNPSLFIRYYNHACGNDPGMLFLRSDSSQHDIEFPRLDSLSTFPKVIGSTNGLLCLDVSSSFKTAFVLWNPSINVFKRLPDPSVTEHLFKRFWLVSVGLAFNPVTNDYQLVRIVNFQDDETRVEVFKKSIGYWKEIEVSSSFISSVVCAAQDAVALEGVIHWMANWIGALPNRRFMASYDMNREVFFRTVIPEFSAYHCVMPVPYNGSLGLVVHPVFRSVSERLDLWVLNEGRRWTNLFSLDNSTNYIYPVGSWKGSDVIMRKDDDFFLFNVTNETCQALPFNGMEYSYNMFTYVDSLVGVGNEEQVREQGRGKNGAKICRQGNLKLVESFPDV